MRADEHDLRIVSNGGRRRVTSEDLRRMLRKNIRIARWVLAGNALIAGWNAAVILLTKESWPSYVALAVNVSCAAFVEIMAHRTDRMVWSDE